MQINPFSFTLLIPAGISAIFAAYVWRRRDTPGAVTMTYLLLAMTVYALGYGLELSSINQQTMLFWVGIEYLGIVSFVPLWLILVLDFTGRERWLIRRNILLLFIIPVITWILVCTNELHHLFYQTVTVDTSLSFPMLSFVQGPWYWVHTSYVIAGFAVGMLLLLLKLPQTTRISRRQMYAVVIASLAPLAAALLRISRPLPLPFLDLTPYAFTITGVVMAWSLLRFSLIDFVPIVRNTITENLSDGIIVLDDQLEIEEINPAALHLLNLDATVKGKPLETALQKLPEIVNLCRTQEKARMELQTGGYFFDLHLSTLLDRYQHHIGKLLLLHDITSLKRSEEELRQNLLRVEKLNELSRTLNSSLDMEYILQVSSWRAADLVGAASCLVCLLSADGLTFYQGYPEYAPGERPAGSPDQSHSRSLDELVSEALRKDDILLLDGDDLSEETSQDSREARTTCAIIPLVAGDKKIGALVFTAHPEKPFVKNELLLAESIGRQMAITIENVRLFSEVQFLAQTDSLTGLLSRHHFDALAQHEYSFSLRYKSPLSLVMLDIDHFKNINDTFRHAAGDTVLKELSQCIRKSLRAVDLVGRYGGEEIIILLPATGLAEACRTAERLRRQISALQVQVDDAIIQVTVSVGVVEMNQAVDDSLNSLINRADEALYAAKKAGRNCVICT